MVVIENLVKKYGDFCLDVTMEIPAGMIVGLIGKNGAGKSTTIKSVLGLVKPDSGKVTVIGKDIAEIKAKDKENLGVALSESGFSKEFTVDDIEHILRKMYTSFDNTYFQKMCRTMNLPTKKPVKDFSTGMKAKVRVLAAMSHRAKLLILDEPTAGLDVEARMEILDLIRDYLAEDEERAVLITSHISTDLEGLCDVIYLIHDGKIILREETDQILARYAILKLDQQQMNRIDTQYILKSRKDSYGYTCLTDQKQFYLENYRDIVIEKAGIDDLILILTGGRR